MTYRDPHTDERISGCRTFMDRSYDGYWGNAAIVGTIVAMAVVMTILAYGLSSAPMSTATGPSSSISEPSTTGLGGRAPAAR
ncbi:MAG: hypothetical protein WBZ51_01475 [Xanthobacteraceae bacterium]